MWPEAGSFTSKLKKKKNESTCTAVLFLLIWKHQILITCELKKNWDSWDFTVNVAWDRESYSCGLSKITREGPKDRVWEPLTLKQKASTSPLSVEKKHVAYLECESQPTIDQASSRAEHFRFNLRQNRHFVSIKQ